MAELTSWLVLGLVAGGLARWILPGEEKGGWLRTMILGIIGGFVGGWVARYSGFLSPPVAGEWIPDLRSIGSATVGAIIVLALWKWIRH